MTTETPIQLLSPFNGPVEIGLRALCVLTTAFPAAYALQRLVVFDYFLVHSDDIEGGPDGLHPQTPHRGGEILVRRGVLQDGLALYESRGLLERVYKDGGIFFAATDKSADFLDTLSTEYLKSLLERADWVVNSFGLLDDAELNAIVRDHIGTWGAEFSMESVLWTEEAL
ncbi:MAG: hypothetical protein BVN29_11390 [Nitrospira sp. ST-bin5]|nr:MAG: hypothetical protein BVN29_11390 [Nitrospira sp. ST-bin5]